MGGWVCCIQWCFGKDGAKEALPFLFQPLTGEEKRCNSVRWAFSRDTQALRPTIIVI